MKKARTHRNIPRIDERKILGSIIKKRKQIKQEQDLMPSAPKQNKTNTQNSH